ncbi:mechanosensitive ion channel family protein [Methanococcoides methylutens]|uniref:mechanosensitive ion channel family protein n=1 Tax=Methanococcoides methylutens TaxID=2226 RepID=UPI004044E85E
MEPKQIPEKKEISRKLKKDNVKSKIFNQLLNHIIIIFLFFILPISAMLAADHRGWIVIPEIVLGFLKLVDTVLISYTLATIFIKFTMSIILKMFESVGKREEKILLSKIYIGFIYALTSVVIFWQVGIDTQSIVIFLGLLATGFAFAIREVILSYFIWFILLTKKPFKIGDYISIGDEEGQVKHIGLFYVVIYPTRYEDFYKIPNKVFLEKSIKNYGTGTFESSFEYYIKEIPANLTNRIDKMVKKARSNEGIDVRLKLDSDCDGLKLTAYYRSTFKERENVKHKLLSIILEGLSNPQP